MLILLPAQPLVTQKPGGGHINPKLKREVLE
jgi:hypothetical protein